MNILLQMNCDQASLKEFDSLKKSFKLSIIILNISAGISATNNCQIMAKPQLPKIELIETSVTINLDYSLLTIVIKTK